MVLKKWLKKKWSWGELVIYWFPRQPQQLFCFAPHYSSAVANSYLLVMGICRMELRKSSNFPSRHYPTVWSLRSWGVGFPSFLQVTPSPYPLQVQAPPWQSPSLALMRPPWGWEEMFAIIQGGWCWWVGAPGWLPAVSLLPPTIFTPTLGSCPFPKLSPPVSGRFSESSVA